MGMQNHGNKCHFLETILHNVDICDNLTATTYKKNKQCNPCEEGK